MVRKMLSLILLLVLATACAPAPPATPTPSLPTEVKGHMVVLPKVLKCGGKEFASVTLLAAQGLAQGLVKLSLWQEGRKLEEKSMFISGKGMIPFDAPAQPGEYKVVASGPGFREEASLTAVDRFPIFLETDKPIYKPGQTVHIRVVTLDSDLLPHPAEVMVTVRDAKGNKVFKRALQTDEYGMAELDLPLSNEPNLGTWKIIAQSGENSTQLDIEVEKYVLPKYEVKIELEKEWFLVNEPIEGEVTAEYSFGKKVKGKLEVIAKRYVGEWEEYATYEDEIDGRAKFRLPPVKYVTGVPAAKGMGNVQLEVKVEEQATGYEQTTTELLTISQAPLSIQAIPESSSFKPGLPFGFLIVTETPANEPVDVAVKIHLTFQDKNFKTIREEERAVTTKGGKALLSLKPPKNCVLLTLEASAQGAYAVGMAQAGYSPSGNFIHLEQVSKGPLKVGKEATFKIYSTKGTPTFYYEVLSRGKVVFSDYTHSDEISFVLTPQMAPSSRLLAYQILPSSEVTADWIPFDVEGDWPHKLSISFNEREVAPGDEVNIDVRAEGKAKIGLGVVDRSVYILAEKRLNLKQVFEALERLYMKPQIELHEGHFLNRVFNPGAKDLFEEAGVIVLTDKKVPAGAEIALPRPPLWERLMGELAVPKGGPMVLMERGPAPVPSPPGELAEVKRVRQYFPETWLWETLTTDGEGKATLSVEAPDTITEWKMRAVGISKEKGLGVSEDTLKVFQPFFLKLDLPYSCIRGEEFPVKVALYNYLESPQEIHVKIEEADWFKLKDEPEKVVSVGPQEVGSCEFFIKPTELGKGKVKITARSAKAADAVVKSLLVEPEGVEREEVRNIILSAGETKTLNASFPEGVVEGSERAYLALTASYLAQTIEGLERLLVMPFGCGEQNIMCLAPDIFIAHYLEETGQMKPEVMAKADMLMTTGYQRQLTFRRSDGSFSAFGENDKEGSLFLTAFVLKTFAQAKGLMYVDPEVLDTARAWIISHQNADGSFPSVGFICHKEIMGGVQGREALTAYVAVALLEAGEVDASRKALNYLEKRLHKIEDPFTMALTSYALELGGSPAADEAIGRLMDMAIEDENGLHWQARSLSEREAKPRQPPASEPATRGSMELKSADIEATGYGCLALLKAGDRLNAGRAAKWLVSQRNAFGGFNSTQDTVVALQALTSYAAFQHADVDLLVTVETSEGKKELRITPENFDVLQVFELPVGERVEISAEGKGEAIVQLVKRYNLPSIPEEMEVFHIDVEYDTHQVEVNDRVGVKVKVKFNPPIPIEAGMSILDISVPTGFRPVQETLEEVVDEIERITRYDIAQRKVIFYIEDMAPGDELEFEFQAQACYPVKAKGAISSAYSYYKPEWRGETLSKPMVIIGD